MSKPFQIFLTAFLISAPMWWGINTLERGLENFVYAKISPANTQAFATANTQTFTAEIAAPILNQQKSLDIQAKSAFSVIVDDSQSGWHILYEQNQKQPLPIASLTKLMTALVVLENYDLTQQITISEKAVGQQEDAGQLKIGEILTANDLLHIALIESSNDAAYALAEPIGVDNFVNIMNLSAKNIGMRNTHFSNPTGLDSPENYSTAQDLAILTRYLLDRPLIWEILQKPEYKLYLSSGTIHHILKNTNLLLTGDSSWKDKIYGGKTGYTLQANGCLVLVIKDNDKYLINIILGADDRFGQMQNLIDNEL
jgi:D-alanyl-D-alanine carboxypeptidase